MKNIYTYDFIYIDYAVIGEPAILRVMNYSDCIEKQVMTASPVTAIQNDGSAHTRIETEMSVIQTI